MPASSLSTALILLGVVCLIAGAAGATIKAFSTEVGPVVGPGRALTFCLGIALIIGGFVVKSQDTFHVTTVSAQWDYSDTYEGPCGAEPYTLEISTAGSKGGSVSYRLFVNNRPEPIQTFQANDPKSYPIPGTVSVARAAEDGTGKAELRVSVLSPAEVESATTELDLQCQGQISKASPSSPSPSTNSTPTSPSTPSPTNSSGAQTPSSPLASDAELKAQVSTFLARYGTDVAKYGKGSPQVTDLYYHYPLTWYRAGTFKSADKYRNYSQRGQPTTKPSSSQTPTPTKCHYAAPFVASAVALDDGRVSAVTDIGWTRTDQSAKGDVLVFYDLLVTPQKSFQIEKVTQNVYSTPCDSK